jgi:hypothetical protein
MTLLIAVIALAGCTVGFVLHPLVAGRSASMREDPHELTEAQHPSLRDGVVCHECAASNPRGIHFCGECGRPLQATGRRSDG